MVDVIVSCCFVHFPFSFLSLLLISFFFISFSPGHSPRLSVCHLLLIFSPFLPLLHSLIFFSPALFSFFLSSSFSPFSSSSPILFLLFFLLSLLLCFFSPALSLLFILPPLSLPFPFPLQFFFYFSSSSPFLPFLLSSSLFFLSFVLLFLSLSLFNSFPTFSICAASPSRSSLKDSLPPHANLSVVFSFSPCSSSPCLFSLSFLLSLISAFLLSFRECIVCVFPPLHHPLLICLPSSRPPLLSLFLAHIFKLSFL